MSAAQRPGICCRLNCCLTDCATAKPFAWLGEDQHRDRNDLALDDHDAPSFACEVAVTTTFKRIWWILLALTAPYIVRWR